MMYEQVMAVKKSAADAQVKSVHLRLNINKKLFYN